MADQDLSTTQLPSLPLPVQGSDLIHVVRSGRDYKATKTNLLQQFLSGLEDVSLASLQAGHILIYNAVSGKWENSTLSWGSILSKPSVFPPVTHVHSWSDLSEVPTSFTPSAHTHLWGEITGKPAAYPPEDHDHDDRYFTETELSASGGGGRVHWDNITNVPELGSGSGDMLKATYDPDNDGSVAEADHAVNADTAAQAPWAGITGLPADFTPSAHTHPWTDITDKPDTFTPSAHDHDDRYFTKAELSTSGGGGQVHWDNITNTPPLGGAGDGPWNYKGGIGGSSPMYPAGVVGDVWVFADEGIVGGIVGGTRVHWSDLIYCIADNAGGTEAAVGASWLHIGGGIGTVHIRNNDGHTAGHLVEWGSGNQIVDSERLVAADPEFTSGNSGNVPTYGAVKTWVTAQLAALPPAASSWGDITDKPTVFPPDVHTHLWADITDKPTTFTPASHTHLWADITDKPSLFSLTAGEIVALDSKSPVDLDSFLIEDSDGFAWGKKRVIFADIKGSLESHFNTVYQPAGTYLSTGAGEIAVLPAKATPVDADKWVLEDSADSDKKKSVLWSSIKATLKTYNDTLYAAIGTIPICLQAAAASFSPADSTTYYFGSMPSEVPTTTDARYRIYIPMTGTVARAYVFWEEWGGVAGTAESITAKFHYDGTTDTTIASVANVNAAKVFQNTALNIAVTAGHYFEIALVCPAWATNPTLVRLSAVVYMY